MNIVRDNLLTQFGYTPYCGNVTCGWHWPRTTFKGLQFHCRCGWVSAFEPEFIEQYRAAQAKLKAAWHCSMMTSEPLKCPDDEAFRQHQRDRIAEAQRHDAEQAKLKLTDSMAAPAQPDRIMAVVEQIAQQWDGCNYEASGEDIDIGEAIRMAGARFADGVMASDMVQIPKELLREARDNCEASIAETGISIHRKEYRVDLHKRLKAALTDGVPEPVAPNLHQRSLDAIKMLLHGREVMTEADRYRINLTVEALNAVLFGALGMGVDRK